MTAAFVLMQIGGGAGTPEIHSALHAVPGVKTVHFLAGPTDVIAYVECPDEAGLMASIGRMRAVKGVASTDTRIVLPV